MRGKVEDVPSTGKFILACTNIPLVSTTLNLNNLSGQQLELQVVNTGTATSPVLDVRSATPAAKTFDMGNLKIGSPERWEVLGAPGAMSPMFLDATAHTGYLPLGPAGTWLLGTSAALIAQGTISGEGKLEIRFTTPNVRQLIGISFTAQAVIVQGGALLLTNPGCKAVRAS